MPASLVFPAPCPSCAAEARFIEFKMESCLQPDEGPPKAWRGFRCLACGARHKQVAAADGVHAWDGDVHVVRPATEAARPA